MSDSGDLESKNLANYLLGDATVRNVSVTNSWKLVKHYFLHLKLFSAFDSLQLHIEEKNTQALHVPICFSLPLTKQ